MLLLEGRGLVEPQGPRWGDHASASFSHLLGTAGEAVLSNAMPQNSFTGGERGLPALLGATDPALGSGVSPRDARGRLAAGRAAPAP
jgi:hypothetical protein